jgi:isovaleryl-CoA dehydrogenase
MLRTLGAALGCSLSARAVATGQLLPAVGLLAGARGLTAQAAPAAHERAPQQEQEEELEEFRDTVRTFAQDFVAPHAAEIDRLNAHPPGFDFWRKAGEWGLHGGWGGWAGGSAGGWRLHPASALLPRLRGLCWSAAGHWQAALQWNHPTMLARHC